METSLSNTLASVLLPMAWLGALPACEGDLARRSREPREETGEAESTTEPRRANNCIPWCVRDVFSASQLRRFFSN